MAMALMTSLLGLLGPQRSKIRLGELCCVWLIRRFGANLNLSTLNGSNGFKINGIDAGDNSGESVSNAGDVNGDGFDDIIGELLPPDQRSEIFAVTVCDIWSRRLHAAVLNVVPLDHSSGTCQLKLMPMSGSCHSAAQPR